MSEVAGDMPMERTSRAPAVVGVSVRLAAASNRRRGRFHLSIEKGVVMIKTRRLFAVALAACIATPASAAGPAYLARAGGGTTCTLAAPCNGMATAISVAGLAGEVICLDKANFGSAIISQSVTISCGDDLWEAPGAGISIGTPAGSSVSIEGLVLDGNGVPGTAFAFSGQGSLSLHRVRVGNNPGSNSDGLLFQPSGRATLHVSDSIFYNNGTGTGGGIVIRPQAGGSAEVALERVIVNGNAFGIAADGTSSTAGINMTIADSMTAGNSQDGILAATSGGGAPIGVMVTNTKSVNNAFGIRSIGPSVTVRAGDNTITGNSTGLSFSGGGALLSYGTNKVQANGADGAFSGPVGLQ